MGAGLDLGKLPKCTGLWRELGFHFKILKTDDAGALVEDEVGKSVHQTVARARSLSLHYFSAARTLVDLVCDTPVMQVCNRL